MFASLKNKIREETGSDLSKITSSWRSGALLGRQPPKEESSLSPKLESNLEERLTISEVSDRLREKDEYWHQRLDQLRSELVAAQGEEAAASQAVARAAAAEAATVASERDAALKQLYELKETAAAARLAQDKLDAVTEELELSGRERSRQQAEQRSLMAELEARLRELSDELALVKATLPATHPHHQFEEQESAENKTAIEGCDEGSACWRERAVLRRQLQETRLALADVKTSWSGQIASLETQVARVSRQAGEEGAERRRALQDNRELRERLAEAERSQAKLRQQLGNSEAKVARLSGEASALAAELRDARASGKERILDLERRLRVSDEEDCALRAKLEATRRQAVEENDRLRADLEEKGRLRADQEENGKLRADLEEENDRLRADLEEENDRLRADLEATRQQAATTRDSERVAAHALISELQNDLRLLERQYDKEKRDKDEALLRNAQLSQSLELQRVELRAQRSDTDEARDRIMQLEALIAQHTENQAACMLIQQREQVRTEELQRLSDTETRLRSIIDQLNEELLDKNKKIKSLEQRVMDMKKSLARELANGRADDTSAEEAEISRRYLKHVVLRFLTARSEARQLTRALATLLRLSAQEEAALHAALPARTALASWFT